MRITHDSKNPLVIGLGRPGAMTTEQKRDLGICACVGTMIEYADPNREKKEACRAYVANLSLNTDKSSYANLQHLLHSLKQAPLSNILESKEILKVEICTDNAPPYISREFLYGITKNLTRLYPI